MIGFTRKTKLRIIIVILVSVIFISIPVISKYEFKKELEKQAEHLNNISEFESKAEIDNPPNLEEYNLHTSIEPDLVNIYDFLDNINSEDNGLTVTAALSNSVKYMNIILESIKKYDVSTVYKYNSDVILNAFGITTEDEFDYFVEKIKKVDNIDDYKMDIETMKEENRTYYFNIELIGKENVVLPVKCIVKDNYNMIYTIYWNME